MLMPTKYNNSFDFLVRSSSGLWKLWITLNFYQLNQNGKPGDRAKDMQKIKLNLKIASELTKENAEPISQSQKMEN